MIFKCFNLLLLIDIYMILVNLEGIGDVVQLSEFMQSQANSRVYSVRWQIRPSKEEANAKLTAKASSRLTAHATAPYDLTADPSPEPI